MSSGQFNALARGVQTALDLIYPSRCLTCGGIVAGDFGLCGPCWRETGFIGGAICDCCGVPVTGSGSDGALQCDGCLAKPPPWQQGRAALLYRDTARRLVWGLKYGDRQEVARPAGFWMANAAADLLKHNMVVVPVPLHWRRLVARRYNQSALLATALARETGHECCLDLLQRTRRTPPLKEMSHAERFSALKGAIRVHPKKQHWLTSRPVLLVDDVMTSGATLNAAAQACLAAGSGPVCVVTLARAAKDT